jgi:dihydrofolate reductase
MRKLSYSMWECRWTASSPGPTARSTGRRPTRSCIASTTSRRGRSARTSADGGSTRRWSYWETADENPSLPEPEREFAGIWQDLPKIVFSKTLEKVEGNARLATDGVAEEEVARLKEQPGKDLAVGGAGLASTCTRLGVVDEYRLFVSPVVLGGDTPYFPALDERIDLELVETRTFDSRVVYLRYRRVTGSGSHPS